MTRQIQACRPGTPRRLRPAPPAQPKRTAWRSAPALRSHRSRNDIEARPSERRSRIAAMISARASAARPSRTAAVVRSPRRRAARAPWSHSSQRHGVRGVTHGRQSPHICRPARSSAERTRAAHDIGISIVRYEPITVGRIGEGERARAVSPAATAPTRRLNSETTVGIVRS